MSSPGVRPMGQARHRRVRPWWALWRSRCACGVRHWPCPDSLPDDRPTTVECLRLRPDGS